MSDLDKMKDAAGKALGDASEKSNAFVQSQGKHLPTIQKVAIGIGIAVVVLGLGTWLLR